MQYEETAPYTRVKPKAQAKAILRKAQTDINHMSSFAIVWHLVKRHRMALVSIWAVLITVQYLFPFALDSLLSIR